MAAWKGGWRKASKGFAVPLTKLQIHALRVLAAQRSPDSYVAVSQGMAPRHFSRNSPAIQFSQTPAATTKNSHHWCEKSKFSVGRANNGLMLAVVYVCPSQLRKRQADFGSPGPRADCLDTTSSTYEETLSTIGVPRMTTRLSKSISVKAFAAFIESPAGANDFLPASSHCEGSRQPWRRRDREEKASEWENS
jgi:hypothetical protein